MITLKTNSEIIIQIHKNHLPSLGAVTLRFTNEIGETSIEVEDVNVVELSNCWLISFEDYQLSALDVSVVFEIIEADSVIYTEKTKLIK